MVYLQIDMDFNVAFGHADGLLNNWDQHLNNILKFLTTENHVKDKNSKAILKHLKSTDNISESKYI